MRAGKRQLAPGSSKRQSRCRADAHCSRAYYISCYYGSHFYITFSAGNAIAEFIGRLLDAISVYIAGVLSDAGAADWVLSLVIDGVIAGVGGVLMFLPNILLLFCFWRCLRTAVIWRAPHILPTVLWCISA